MNPLDQYPAVRKFLYFVQWVYNGLLTLSVAFFAIQQTPLTDAPEWYLYAAGLGPILWTYLGITAQTNVDTTPPDNHGE